MSKKNEPPPEPKTVNVAVIGAGPAGLLAAILLLRRNDNSSHNERWRRHDHTKYRVTLIDPGVDYGQLDEAGLQRSRSWMIGLSAHGLRAIHTVPALYEEYIQGLGVDIEHVVFGVSPKHKFTMDVRKNNSSADADTGDEEKNSFTVDRNFICAALSRYLNDHYGAATTTTAATAKATSSLYVPMYQTRALYVDGDNKVIVARPTTNDNDRDYDGTIPYDLVLGCDGIRSVVRNAFLTTERDFEFDVSGTFGYGKAVHIPLPADVKDGTFMFINQALPGGWGSFILPETNQMLNVALGTNLSRQCCAELQSPDPKVVARYFLQHWHAFELTAASAQLIGEQWVATKKWNKISQVHCNFYHSTKLQALLLGDAAHATSPQIGQGMNTALADAAALDEFLTLCEDDWTKVLPMFSKERVKEGHALTDLSFHTFSLDGTQQIILLVKQNIRRTLHKYFAWAGVAPDPMTEISTHGIKLSEAYKQMKSQFGVIPKVRAVNEKIMRTYFEKSIGLIDDDDDETDASVIITTLRNHTFVKYGLVPVAMIAACAIGFRQSKRLWW